MSNCTPLQRGDVWQLTEASQTRWVFPAHPDDAVNQLVDFLHPFECTTLPDQAQLRISADTDFMAWLNGKFIGCGQYSDYPDQKTYEVFCVDHALQTGTNQLAVTVFYNGRNSSVYRRGEPGLLFEIVGSDVLAASGTTTLCRPNPCYHSGPIAIVSGQLSYTFGYDARHEDDFPQGKVDTTEGWRPIDRDEATLPATRAALSPRPIPRLVDGGVTPAVLLAAGTFKLDTAEAETEHESKADGQYADGLRLESGTVVSPGWQMQKVKLTERDTRQIVGLAPCALLAEQDNGLSVALSELDEQDGIYLLFDLGQEEVGHLELDLEAAEGTIVDIGYGQHIEDGRVRTRIGGRNFAGRYLCGKGRRSFTHKFLRWSGRYLQVHVHAAEFALYHIGLRRCDYPAKDRGCVDTRSELHGRIHDVGCRTLRLCMHEHYEDTPWREQALYANDARTQALCGYYAFGETDMPRSSFSLLGQGTRGDGFLYLTAPALQSLTIPSFTLVWMLAVRDHFLYSGDDRLAKTFLPQICSMLQAFLNERKGALLPLRQQDGIWHFYDWSAGMSGYSNEAFAKGLRVDAPLNCFLVLAIEAAQQMLDWSGQGRRQDFDAAVTAARQELLARFWDPSEDAFRTHENAKRFTELTQALAVLAGVGDDAIQDRVLERMGRSDSGLAEPGLSQSFYTFEALMTRKEQFGPHVLATIEQTWGKMLEAGATTFWETIKGANDFGNAGSLCHGWSAAPVYVFYHDVLGVKPLSPGFGSFAVDPMSSALQACSGTVPVPNGEIHVSWQRTDKENVLFEVKAPEGLNWEK